MPPGDGTHRMADALVAMTGLFSSKTDFLVRSVAERFVVRAAATTQFGLSGDTVLHSADASHGKWPLE